MDAGGVGCLRSVQEASAVARAVMRYTDHTLLVGDQGLYYHKFEAGDNNDSDRKM